MGLENLKSIFQENIEQFADTFESNRPQDMNDTKFQFGSFISQTYNYSVDVKEPILDTLLRGRIYEPGSISSTLIDTKLFVEPEAPPFTDLNFISETYDPRTPKNDGIQFNNIDNTFSQPTSQFGLGVQFFNGENNENNLSWDTLYTSDHKSKENPSWQGIQAISYPNVNRDKLDIRDSNSNSNFFSPSRNSIIDNISEPYIVSKIGDGGRDQNAGNRSIPLMRATTDLERISKFLSSPAGLTFIGLQNLYAFIPIPVVGSHRTSSILPRGTLSSVSKRAVGAFQFPARRDQLREDFGSNEMASGLEDIDYYKITTIGGTSRSLSRVPQRFGVTYNPLATLATIGASFTSPLFNPLFKRSGFDFLGDALSEQLGINEEYSKDSTTGGFNIDDTFNRGGSSKQKDRTFLQKLGDAFTNLGAGASANVTPPHTGDKATLVGSDDIRGIDQFGNLSESEILEDKYQEGPVTGYDNIGQLSGGSAGKLLQDRALQGFSGNSTEESDYNTENEKDGMPLYFKDLRDGTYTFFRAYIEGLTENVSPTWTPHNYIGRSEPVYTYERGERDINFNLKLVAQTKAETSMIYKKMNRLTSMAYPDYQKDDYGNRMKPPLVKFRLGDIYGSFKNELLGFLKSISYSVDQSSTYETQVGMRGPTQFTVAISYQVIHSKVPSLYDWETANVSSNKPQKMAFYGVNKYGRSTEYN